MYYHASPKKGLKILKPSISNHKKSLVYFSDKRENILVYLSNAIEKYCVDTNFKYNKKYTKWASYGFDKKGTLVLQEYYPNATYDTYKGVSGYIYKVKNIKNIKKLKDIRNVYVTNQECEIDSVEYISDAYEEIMQNVKEGKLILEKYDDFIKRKKDWLEKNITDEYKKHQNQKDYIYFLENKFKDILEKNKKV